jgi:ribose transport system substrate-binding protein
VRRVVVGGGAALLATSFMAACSSEGSTGSSGGDGKTPASVIADAKAAVEAAYGTGFDGQPPATGPEAVTGKNVWYISCGQQAASCSEQASAFQQAADILGWNVTLGDSKLDSTVEASLVRQAVAAHADGIAINAFDCNKGKAVLEAARAANIPVVNWNGVDCGAPGSPESLFTASVKVRGSEDPKDWFSTWGKLMADYAIAQMNGEGKLIFLNETTYTTLLQTTDAYKAEIAKAPGIEVIDAPFTIGQIPNQTTPLIKSALLANPDADAVQTEIDSLVALGLESAIAAGPNPDIKLFGAEGTAANFDYIRQGKQVDSLVRLDVQSTWAQADTLNRIFAGEDPSDLPDQGSGFQIVDKDHNLPAQSGIFQAPIDYEAAYTKLWTGQ